jgi:hypothetical protein
MKTNDRSIDRIEEWADEGLARLEPARTINAKMVRLLDDLRYCPDGQSMSGR